MRIRKARKLPNSGKWLGTGSTRFRKLVSLDSEDSSCSQFRKPCDSENHAMGLRGGVCGGWGGGRGGGGVGEGG